MLEDASSSDATEKEGEDGSTIDPSKPYFAAMFDEECVTAMMFGMTPEQYYEGDPELFLMYAKLYVKKSKAEFAERDNMAWMIGFYVQDALGVVASHVYGKKGTTKPTYPEAPVFIEQLDEDAKRRKQERELRKMEANLLAAARRFNTK